MKKTMKKYFLTLVLATAVPLTVTSTCFAGVTTLWRHSAATFVTTEHAGGLSATYHGTASVKGSDRTLKNNRNHYFIWTKITYDVQGKKTVGTANSGGKNNTKKVVKNITAKDKLNFGSKTKAKYDYATGIADGSIGRSLDDSEVFYGGGVVELE